MVWQAKLGLPNHPRILMWSENIIASQIPVWSSKLEAGEIVIHANSSANSDLGNASLQLLFCPGPFTVYRALS